jgi:hypothetical protein
MRFELKVDAGRRGGCVKIGRGGGLLWDKNQLLYGCNPIMADGIYLSIKTDG